MARKDSAGASRIEAIKHRDRRKHIPTRELDDFVAEEERSPKTLLYSRDPSLDPQLVWKGKEEQGRIGPQADGKLVVEIRGVDIYDPTTGEIRSSSTDDIACWFIDTDYNGKSLFVRHAYFTGAGDPYERLRRALRAEVDEAAWSRLYSTTSYPFDPPRSGKIAVKVINHYGDEVLKVFEVARY